MGIAQNTLSQYESGLRPIPDDIKLRLCEIFDISLDYLLGQGDSSKRKGIKIPVLGVIPAGVPIEAIEEIIDYEEITPEMAQSGEFFGLKVKGDSMFPEIKEKDVLIIKKQEDAETGDICAILVNECDATVKKLKKEKDGYVVIPLNPIYEPQYFSQKEILNLPVCIIGKVVEIRRSL